MTPSAKRAKATQLVQWVADRLKVVFPEYEDEITVPRASDKGEDLKFSDDFAKVIGVSLEMKNQRGYAHLYNDMDQAEKNSCGRTPILVVKAPYKSPLVIMKFSDWEKTL